MYFSYTYLIPIADRTPDDWRVYTFAFNKRKATVDYLVDGRRLLQISKVGLPIDGKFKIGDFPGTKKSLLFPENLTFGLAATLPAERGAITTCQEALFDQCLTSQSIYDARRTYCQYAPLQDIPSFSSSFNMTVSNYSIYRTSCLAPPCPSGW